MPSYAELHPLDMVKTYLRDGGGGPTGPPIHKDSESRAKRGIPWGEAESRKAKAGQPLKPEPDS